MENKENNLSSILKHRGKVYTLQDLENTLKRKTPTEVKIIEARKKGRSISELDDSGLRYLTDQVIVKGAAIYGCDMPQTEFFAAILSKELVDFLIDFGYDNLTLSEIILAFRLNADGDFINPIGDNLPQIDFFGSFIHVSFIAKVLKNYMVLRNGLDRKFQNQIDGY